MHLKNTRWDRHKAIPLPERECFSGRGTPPAVFCARILCPVQSGGAFGKNAEEIMLFRKRNGILRRKCP